MSEQNEQNEIGRGNTKLSAQSSYWCFTYNNYTSESIEQIEQVFQHECKWYIFQEEKGEEGTPHLQGICCFKLKKRLKPLKQINPSIHWEVTKSINASIAYCTKEKSRCGNQWVYGIKIPEQPDVCQPYGWQLDVIDIIKNKPDKRTIHWFWEPNGNVGKSELCKYLVVKHNALMLTGKSNDMFNMLNKHPDKRTIVIVDCPRSNLGYINYGALEQIKNGLVFSGKYEGAQLVFNCPHVIVFANEEPDYNAMSLDRWKVIRIIT